jgi:hypothetical protein
MNMQEQTNKMVGANEGENNVWMVGAGMLVAGLIVGFLVGWFWQKSTSQVNVDDTQNNASSTSILATSTVPVLETIYKSIDVPALVSVDDQQAGSLVFIKHAEASKPTWVAVREIVNGAIGNILGAGMVTGATDDMPVTLLRPTVAGGQYAVFLYQDDGNGQFDSKTDLLVMQNALPVATMFTAQ